MPVTMLEHRWLKHRWLEHRWFEHRWFERRWTLAPLFVLVQLALVHWAAGGERPPAPPDLARFPAEFGEWKQVREDPITADIAAELGADRLLSRIYIHRPAGLLGSVLVVWYQSQRAGHSQPHSPQ